MNYTIPDIPSALKSHKLDEQDYKNILEILGREPNIIELGIFSAMWSEHCSYKSSKKYLHAFPTSAPWVVQGPGENAGIIDIGQDYCAVFKVESHNHPSFIEPYAGAATGVGGIMRDIFTMGARVVASLNSLRFGEIQREDEVGKKQRALLKGVVAGIGGYGNCIGVPTIGGEISFEPCYNGNIIVNAFSLGIVKKNEIFYAKASGVGNPVIYVGSKTGRDGLGGAVMSSDSFTQENTSLRPTVQIGDPFIEKLLMEACLELFKADLIVGIQDMGAAGLTSSSFEMAGRSGSGMILHLDKVPMREEGMNPYDLMLSESQERMLICGKKGCEEKIFEIFKKYDLDVALIGEVTQSGRMQLYWHNELCADIPIDPLSEKSPILSRPVQKPTYLKQTAMQKYQGDGLSPNEILELMLAHPEIADKACIYEQYDNSIGTNTLLGSGKLDGSLLRVKQNNVALAIASECNPRYCYLDPKEGSKIAVALAGRKCVSRGAMPLAISDCLNFGNPQNPEVMWQFAQSTEGIKEACKVLQTPVVSGNVSLYNQTNDQDIYPTPTIVSVGVAEDAHHTLSSKFSLKDTLFLLGEISEEFGGSLLAKLSNPNPYGLPPKIDLDYERKVWEFVLKAHSLHLLKGAKSVGRGGVAIALCKMALLSELSLNAQIPLPLSPLQDKLLFSETQSLMILSSECAEELKDLALSYALPLHNIASPLPKEQNIQINSLNISYKKAKELYFESFKF
ncbi:phosphoribosylformylglycinamidine synthase subunit PurL [Helicobacter cholecystus]|uniref:Phosphoribosylformylglycinamidine synthase subunit PurL n=1 Tax=Helicobacter cholecystus TaxID=45498 RepID=A0A3D8IU17_9HELI|nr:phosphoribosylformylglycinamidine synthase subunit PurL [Helicobacter cholecystus]RDU68779.1 phosphoribosylformylglycinamidine synthase subunit PurL [Helicobacter cholecystus]VEJ23943.1 phosphoribosylformylglycinamidine synthase [Helicobacter cholecystus]